MFTNVAPMNVNQQNGTVRPVMSTPLLHLREVAYQVGSQRLLGEITLSLNTGARTIVLGPNGAGKSLLLRLCHGLIAPTAGKIIWERAGGALVRQAMVFQRPVLLRRSVAANIDYALAVHGQSPAQRHDRVQAALQLGGLQALATRPARVLSGGEQQRVALARAWVSAPEVVFLDEPTANLDPAATRAVEEIIDNIARAGTTIVMTTHDLGQARRLADEVVFLHHGRVLEHRNATGFFESPDSDAAKAFLRGELLW
jgi:tungstate transport system ATP-binding protein